MKTRTRCFFHQILPALILLVSCITASGAETGKPAALFEQANNDYSRGNFAEAARQYEQFIETYGFSAPSLYNLGNSYVQTSRPGKAVLAYLRALRLSPNNPDIKGNLQLIRKETGLFQGEKTVPQQIAFLLEMDQWSLLAGCAFGALTLLHLFAFFLPVGRKWLSGLSALFILATLFSVTCSWARYQDYYDGVVTRSDVNLLISPFEAAKSAGRLQEGLVVRPVKPHGDYVLVEEENGRSGWLHKGDFELIVPAD